MKAPRLSGLRARLIALVLLTVLPAVALILYNGHYHGTRAKEQALREAQQLVAVVVADHAQLLADTRQLLLALARLPEVWGDADTCHRFLAKLKAGYSHYANFAVTAPTGPIVCSAHPLRRPIDASDRSWFQRAIQTRRFALGDYQMGRVVGRPVLVAAHPEYDRDGRLRAVLFASLDTQRLHQLLTKAPLAEGTSIMLLDSRGTVLSHYPEAQRLLGSSRADTALGRAVLERRRGTIETPGADGVPRLYAFAPLAVAGAAGAYVVVGIPRQQVLAEVHRARDRTLLALAAVALVVLLAAWFGGDVLLLRRVRVLTAAAARFRTGELTTLTGLPPRDDELDPLARAMDEMATALHMRDAEFARAMDALRESEGRFRNLVETTSDWIWEVDARGVYTYASPRVEALLGYAPEEVVGKTPFDLMPPDEAARVRSLFAGIAAARRPIERLENVNLHKDGRRVVLETSGVPLLDRAGALAGYRGIDRDITARKQAEAALQKSSEILERMFENTQFHVAYLDRDFNFIRVNKAYADACRHPPEFFPGKNHFALYPNAENEAIFRRVVETGQPFTIYAKPFEFPDQPERGTTWWDWTLSPVRDADAKVAALVFALVDVTERVKAEQRAGYLHLHDELTGLPNRLLLLDRLQQALVEAARRRREAAVLCVDLDRFKYVNETLGHAAGDALLKEAAARLSACVRPGDTVARLAGDEFVVVLADMAAVDDVGRIVQKIMGCGAKPFAHREHEYFMSVSLGIALYPLDGGSADQLLKYAELAMHQAKERGGNNFQFYSSQMADKASERVSLSNELRQALERGEFVLYYQPQIDIAGGGIVGAEALIRWQHPQRGLVAPATFIPLAEETGLIGPLGEWVLRAACDQLRAWDAAGLPGVRVAVNVSAQQFRHGNLAHAVGRALRDCTLPPHRLEIEITESTLMVGDGMPLDQLRQIADMGVSISIDDFGTGYSALSYLQQLPIDNVKIDRSFVQDMAADHGASALVNAIVAMAHALELKVVAEGVERDQQLARLRAYGCDLAQGFYFSPPLPAEEFARLLREQHAHCQGKDYVN